ncbi:MAG: DUF502 domain-containing protein [Pseudomonadota bacterium]
MSAKPEREKQKRRRRVSIWQRARNNFLTGIVVVAPVVVTLWLTWNTISFVDSEVMPLVPAPYHPRTWVGIDVPGYGVLVFLTFTVIVGWFAKKVFGRQFILFGEAIVGRTPVVRSIYNALKQLVETVLSQSKSSFQKACLVEYPRRGVWAVAFISTQARGEIPEAANVGHLVSVFLPTTPNPTSGFLLFVPEEDVIPLDMSIEDAAKLVISAGLVIPPTKEELLARSEEVQARREHYAELLAPREGEDKDRH